MPNLPSQAFMKTPRKAKDFLNTFSLMSNLFDEKYIKKNSSLMFKRIFSFMITHQNKVRVNFIKSLAGNVKWFSRFYSKRPA